MGNTLLQPVGGRQLNPIKSFEEFVMQNPELSNRQYLSENKSFRTVQFSIKDDAKIIMKVYLKRDVIQLASYFENLNIIKRRLTTKIYPNLFPYHKFINFDKNEEDFVAVARQYVHTSLSDRFQAIPKLTTPEQYWIITQIIIGIYNLHNERLFHGNIKASNILLTTWLHVFISDFASYKPFYINDISQFKYFYFTSELNCSLAPEKFSTIENFKDTFLLSDLTNQAISILQKMDLFSLGCLITEILLNGEPLFDYEQLQNYIKNEYDPYKVIKKIPNDKIQKLVGNLIDKDPNQRMRIEEILIYWFSEFIPDKGFDLLYYIDAAFLSPNFSSPDIRIGLFKKLFPLIYEEYIAFNDNQMPVLAENLPIPVQEIKILFNFTKFTQETKPNLFDILKKQKPNLFIVSPGPKEEKFKFIENNDNLIEKDISHMINNFQLKKKSLNKKELTSSEKQKNQEKEECKEDFKKIRTNGSDSLAIIAQQICSNIRNVRFISSKLAALEILNVLSDYLTDYVNFHLICPYICSLFDEALENNDEMVLSYAFSVFCHVLSTIKDPFQNVSDCKLYSSFVWENITKVLSNQNMDMVQTAFANNMDLIIRICHTFFYQSYLKKIPNFNINHPDYQKDLIKLKKKITEFVHNVLSHKNLEIQEITVANIHYFYKSELYEPNISEPETLSRLISCLNKIKKAVFLKHFPNIAQKLPFETINDIIIPCIDTCINDLDEMVVLESVKCFKELVKLKLLSQEREKNNLIKIMPLAIHPNRWIREEVIDFLGAILDKNNSIDVYCYIQPLINKYLKEKVILTKEILEFVLPEMLTKDIVQNMRDAKKNKYEYQFKSDIEKYFYEDYLKNISSTSISTEDKSQFETIFNEINKFDSKNSKNLCSKLNNFLIQSFFENIPDNIYVLLGKFEGNEFKKKKELKTDEVFNLMRNFLLEERHRIDISSNDLSNFKYKFLCSLEIELATSANYFLEKKGLQGTHFVNLMQNKLLEINNILFKMKQFEVLNEIDLGIYKNDLNTGGGKKIPKMTKPSGNLVTTIYEHEDSVSCLESLRDSKFISGSYDGYVRVFDLDKIESDFTSESIAAFKCEEDEQKIKCLKYIEGTLSILVGTDKGIIDLFYINCFPSSGQISKNTIKSYLGRYQVNGEVKKIENLKQEPEKLFIYATSKGEIGIEDLRSKSPAMKFNCGMERGGISSMTLSNKSITGCIGTLNGYLLLFDLRYNLIYNIFQLNDHDKKPLPIVSLSNFYQVNSAESEYITISMGSNNHEIGIYNVLNTDSDYLNPEYYFVSTFEETPTFKIPYLVHKKEEEVFTNSNYRYSERSVYEYFSFHSSYKDVVTFLDDPLIENENKIKSVWFKDSLNSLQKTTDLFKFRNMAKKVVNLPTESIYQPANSKNLLENVLVTAGNDRNIRFWQLQNEVKGQKEVKKNSFQINCADGRERAYKQEKSGGITIVHEFEKNRNYNNFYEQDNYSNSIENGMRFDERVCHKDAIEDVIYVEREKGVLVVSCSRDSTIKIWK